MTKLLIILTTFFSALFHPAFISPLPVLPHSTVPQTIEPTKSFIHYGFLPYWNLKFTDTIPFDQLTHLAYFALPINTDGTLNTTDLGYRRLISSADSLASITSQYHLFFDLVIKNADDQTLFSFLANPTAHDTLIDELKKLHSHYPFDGLNIDFEPVNATDAATAHNLTKFVKKLKSENSKLKISIDIYPSAATSLKLWDLPELASQIDYIIVMGYDYYRPSSGTAGPIAPLYVTKPTDQHALMPDLAQISRLVPPAKLILGIPIYGYEWPTTDDQYLSSTLRSGSLASLARIDTLLQSIPVVSHWNTTTFTPWFSYVSGHQTRQIYYENPRSLQLKKELITSAGLSGYAVWALGYENRDPLIWYSLNN